jgi:glycosyltransferase involved in cell wall biosynthesis
VFVGKTDATPRYYDSIRALIERYRMPQGRFIFTGPVPDEDLAAYYRTASVYISLSEHEGFCVPLLEACRRTCPCSPAHHRRARHAGRPASQFAPKDIVAAELLGSSPTLTRSGLK